MEWGLVPSWALSTTEGPRPINARMESLAAKPIFAEALRRRRVVIPADAFYEWREVEGLKQPYAITARDGAPLALAGLWDRWTGTDGATCVTCTIVTTPANDTVIELHDRMPAILADRDRWEQWLAPGVVDVDALIGLLEPAPTGLLEVRPVSRMVNSVGNDGPELLSAP